MTTQPLQLDLAPAPAPAAVRGMCDAKCGRKATTAVAYDLLSTGWLCPSCAKAACDTGGRRL